MDSKHFWTKPYGNPQNGQIHSGFTRGVFYVRARREIGKILAARMLSTSAATCNKKPLKGSLGFHF